MKTLSISTVLLGMIIGVGIGAALGKLALGIGIGMALAIAVSLVPGRQSDDAK